MNTNKRNIRNITELTNKMVKCECGGLMTIYNYGSHYRGECNKCNAKTKPYDTCISLMNEQYEKFRTKEKKKNTWPD